MGSNGQNKTTVSSLGTGQVQGGGRKSIHDQKLILFLLTHRNVVSSQYKQAAPVEESSSFCNKTKGKLRNKKGWRGKNRRGQSGDLQAAGR